MVLFVRYPYTTIFMATLCPAIMAIINKMAIRFIMAQDIKAQNMAIRVI